MIDILQNFEQASGRLSPLILIGPGIAAVVLGLFIWLGGIGFRKWLLAVAGGVIGAVCGIFVIGRNLPLAIALAVIGAAMGAIFQRLLTAILAAALAALVAFCVLAHPYVDDARPVTTPAKQSDTLSLPQSARLVGSYATEFDAAVRRVCSQMPVHNWVIMAAVVVGAAAGGFLFMRPASALCCSTLGTMLIFVGMILLLLYKQSAPISSIFSKGPFYAIVFGAMAAFGSVVQLILCIREKPKETRAAKPGKDTGESPSVAKSWRTA